MRNTPSNEGRVKSCDHFFLSTWEHICQAKTGDTIRARAHGAVRTLLTDSACRIKKSVLAD
jgi:hypothetical protein